jgi:hypothetical protein
MNPAIANALKRKKELERELREIAQFLKMHKRFAGRESPATKTLPEAPPTPPMEKVKRRGRPDELASIMEGILMRYGAPMTRSLLADAVEEAGHTIPSDDKARYLGTILWRRHDKFYNTDTGYWLKGVKIPRNAEERMMLRVGSPPGVEIY